MSPARPVAMWAAVVRSTRTEWIHYLTIRRTRAEARAAYLEQWEPEYRPKALKNVRFAKVVISLEEAP